MPLAAMVPLCAPTLVLSPPRLAPRTVPTRPAGSIRRNINRRKCGPKIASGQRRRELSRQTEAPPRGAPRKCTTRSWRLPPPQSLEYLLPGPHKGSNCPDNYIVAWLSRGRVSLNLTCTHSPCLAHPSPNPPAPPSLLLGQSPSAHITRLTPVLAQNRRRTSHPNHHSSGPGNRDSRHSLTRGNLIIDRAYFWHDASSPPAPTTAAFSCFFYILSVYLSHTHPGYIRICALHTSPSVAPSPTTGSNTVRSCLTGKAPPSRRSFLDLCKITGGCTCSDSSRAARDFRLISHRKLHQRYPLIPHPRALTTPNLPREPAPR